MTLRGRGDACQRGRRPVSQRCMSCSWSHTAAAPRRSGCAAACAAGAGATHRRRCAPRARAYSKARPSLTLGIRSRTSYTRTRPRSARAHTRSPAAVPGRQSRRGRGSETSPRRARRARAAHCREGALPALRVSPLRGATSHSLNVNEWDAPPARLQLLIHTDASSTTACCGPAVQGVNSPRPSAPTTPVRVFSLMRNRH